MEYITTTLSNLLQQTAFLNLTFGNIVMIFRSADFPVSGNRKRIRAVTASSYFLWYAACKYLSGYYEID